MSSDDHEKFIAEYLAEHSFAVEFEIPVMCAICNTPVSPTGEAGWKHTLAFKARGNCSIPWPGLPVNNEQGEA